jgi:DICT domain-containing protein/signal transduction histidine kinase
MSILTSVLSELQQTLKAKDISVRPQTYFKSSLIALSHAMEDQVLAEDQSPLVIANFQRERFYRQEAHRYQRIAQKTDQVYVLSAPETEFKNHSGIYETVAFDRQDALAQEWHLVVVGQQYATCLICRERTNTPAPEAPSETDTSRRFEGIWTFDRQVSIESARILLDRVTTYRPELTQKVEQAKRKYLDPTQTKKSSAPESWHTNRDPFVQRLVTYLQAGQYKLIKAYRTLAGKEQKERLVHSMGMAIRQSLNPEAVLQVAVEKLGAAIDADRCLVYRCKQTDQTATVHHEFLGDEAVSSLLGQTLPLQENPLFQSAIAQQEVVAVNQITDKTLKPLANRFGIVAWLLVPIFYHDQLVGMMELHRCYNHETEWMGEEQELVNAIANHVGIALIQAEAYASLEDLNEQLEALDRTRSNLVAITGHELRTPLSTIQVCLESLASEPDMPPELRQVMLQTALDDAERMRKLVQDFLTLSQLESGRVQWHPEPISLEECILLSVSHARSRMDNTLPNLETPAEGNLPMVQADGEWLVEVLAKLLDNALKFTKADGEVKIEVETKRDRIVEVTITDTGRGIEPNRLETVFDRFYQEEGALRRTTGGTGLGLAICRQIVKRWGGEIWAESAGKDQGSKFHFTVPIVQSGKDEPKSKAKKSNPAKSSRSRTSKSPGNRKR